ncbi:hypothetical protein KEM54_002926 [Ascosphaera aggregata]|nr:hypothetical protein KEM54_002926 [Ascosphaera aggregata]
MAAVTDITYLKTKNGVELTDPFNDRESPFGRFVAAIKAMSEIEHFSWGHTEEKDDHYNIVFVCEWNGNAKPELPLNILHDVLEESKEPLRFGVKFQPLPFSDAVFPPGKSSSSISPYVCELVALAYPAGADKPGLTTKVNDLLSNLTKVTEVAPAHSYTTGFMLDTILSAAKKPIDVSYSVVQWDSVKAHMDARGTETFAKYIAPLREDLVFSPWQMRHVRFNRVL